MQGCSMGGVQLILGRTMAKVELNSVIKSLRGSIDGVVFKRYGNRIVASKYPDMRRVKRSPAQKAQNERMKCAAIYYRTIKQHPKFVAPFAKRAKASGTTLYRAVTKYYMDRAKKAGRVNILADLDRP